MKDLGYGEPLLRDALEKLPRSPAPLAATSDHAQPALMYLDPKAPEAGEIPGYSMIVEVALYHAPQPFPDFRQRLMHAPPKAGLHLFQFGEASLSDGLAQHGELAVLPGFPTNVCEPQEVAQRRNRTCYKKRPERLPTWRISCQRLFHLTIKEEIKVSPFSAPFFWGIKSEAAASNASGCFMGGNPMV
jgi:hypothetical protein